MFGSFKDAIEILSWMRQDLLNTSNGATISESDVFVITKCIQVLQDAWNAEEKIFDNYSVEMQKRGVTIN